MVVKLDPVGNGAAGMLQRLEAVSVYALLLERADHALDHSVLLRTVRRDERLPQTVTAYQSRVSRLVKTSPLSPLSRNGLGTRPSVPNRAISACSNALEAVLALPLRDKCQPSSSRVWQSITRASVTHPSRPAQTRHISVDPRSFGAVATDGMACTRGRKPIGRFRTRQPINRKIRCTVFLLNPSKCASVRYPNDGDSSISARRSIGEYIDLYNRKRPHSSLADQTPDVRLERSEPGWSRFTRFVARHFLGRQVPRPPCCEKCPGAA